MTTFTYDASVAVEEQQKAIVLLKAADIVITDDIELDMATQSLKTIKQALKNLEAKRKPTADALNKAIKEFNALFKAPKDTLQAAEAKLKASILDYQNRQNALLEQKRIEAEKAAEAQRQAMMIEAEKAAESGDAIAAANNMLAAQLIQAAPVVATKAENTQTRVTYKADVTDIIALARAVADGKVPADAILPNQAFFNDMAKSIKQDGAIIAPGVHCVAVKTLVVR